MEREHEALGGVGGSQGGVVYPGGLRVLLSVSGRASAIGSLRRNLWAWVVSERVGGWGNAEGVYRLPWNEDGSSFSSGLEGCSMI